MPKLPTTTGERINDLRAQLNLTQDEFALALGVASSTISGYENNKYLPETDILIRMANTYGVSIDYILCLNDFNSSAEEIKEIFHSTDERSYSLGDFLQILKSLDSEQVDGFLNYIDVIKSGKVDIKLRLK